jgi:glycosyltransferase involved in cell wall biosynthesis
VAQATADILTRFGGPPTLIVSFRQLRQQSGLACRLLLRRFDVALAFLTDVGAPLYRDFILSYLFFLRAGQKMLRDTGGQQVRVGLREGLRSLVRCLTDLAGLPVIYGLGRWRARRLAQFHARRYRDHGYTPHVAYLRANLWQESKAGGSVAHTTGVLSGLRHAGIAVTYVGTSEFVPAQTLGCDVSVVTPRLNVMRNLPDLPFVAYSESFGRQCLKRFATRPPTFVYQRYSVLNYSGALLAHRLGCPFVLEYNGSEVWIARHWSTPMFFEGLAEQVEMANLRRADLVVVVSRALRDEVASRGISPERVLVNPNGVDPTRYHPCIDENRIRTALGLGGKLVVGFIGTFGPWHGADVLAQAVRPVGMRLPEAHFLFVGDGSGMPRVREILADERMEDRATFTGLVPHDVAPSYLAACDILASPHVGNPDGTPFFGSPTKLFEYMAMGKGIVASDLDQIGEVLTHRRTAWMVKPGDPEDLAEGIVRLGKDATLRRALGDAARAEAVARYTWTAHVERILRKMIELKLLNPSVLRQAPSGEV